MELYNIYAEQSIIGAILLDPSSMSVSSEINLSASDFYIQEHKTIYKAMETISNRGFEIDLVTLSDELRKIEKLDQTGGVAYLSSLITAVPTSENISYYMKIVKDFSIKRNVQSILLDTQKNLKNLTSDELISITNSIKSVVLDNLNVEDLFIDASTVLNSFEEPGSILTGFSYLDTAFGNGIQYGTLTLITGEPSSGKSTILNQIIANAISNGCNSFIYSGELTYQMLLDWFSITAANKDDLIRYETALGRYSKISPKAFELILKWLKNKLFIYSKDAIANEKNLSAVIEHLATKRNVKLFVLDNLMTLECSGYDKYERQITAVKSLKNLAKKYNLVIILVAHPNKTSNMGHDSHVFEISGASEIPNLADYIIKTIRGDDDITKLLILKNRITGVQKKRFSYMFAPFRKRFFTNSQAHLEQDFGYRE